MVMATKTPQGARLNPQNTLELSQGMSIQTAIDTADAHGGNWVIILYSGAVYDEGDLTPNGGADITIKGMGEGRVVIAPTAVPTTAVIVSGFTLNLEEITVTAPDATRPALRVTGGTCEACDCEFNGVGAGDAIQMVAGALHLNDSDVPIGDVDLSTAPCTLNAVDTNFDGTIDTAGAFAHTITMFNCDLGGQTLNLAATGACAYTFHNCMSMSTITDASLLGTGHLCQCDVVGAGLVKNGTSPWIVDNVGLVSVNNANATGVISIFGGVVLVCAGATGSVTWKTRAQQYEVIAGMVIQHAIAAAAADAPAPAATAPYTVLIHPGVYTGRVTYSAYVNLKGVGPKGSVVIAHTSWIVVAGAGPVEIQNLTLRLTGLSGFITPSTTARLTFTDIVLEYTGAAGTAFEIIYTLVASDILLERCSCNITGTGSPVNFHNHSATDGASLTLLDNDFTINNPNAVFLYNIGGTITITGKGNRWAGTCRMFNVFQVMATVTLDHDAVICTTNWTNNNESRMMFRHCSFEARVHASTGAIVRLKNCSYRNIVRTNTGDIIDESPEAKDYAFHVVKLPVTSLDNIATRLAVGGSATLGGSGQLVLRINDNAVDAAGIENNADAAGALTSSFTAGRTIRYVRQLSASALRATTTAFFGLRATLGAAVPGAGEDHFGFDWDGTNFRAVSSDGAGVGQQTNLTTPSTDAQHQLEAIQFRTMIEFYIDGVLVATHTNAAGIPTAGINLDFQDYQISDGLGGVTTSDITLRNGFVQECPA